MGNPTNELRAKLDELGVRWWPDVYYRDTNTCWRVGDFEWRASEKKDGKLLIGCTCVKYLTPEQAIAATVGRCDTMGLWYEWEQVLFANVSDEVAQDNLNECVHELLDKAATMGVGTCHYIPDDAGFTWWDENDVEHYEKHSASDECCFASCDKCGNQMMVGEEGWFDGWDEIIEWWEDDGSYHKGYVLEPRFKRCPNCGARLVGA